MAKNDYWTMRDGAKIKMKDMSDSHLRNSIQFFKPVKNTMASDRWKLLMAEKKRRDKLKKRKENKEPVESRFDILDI